MSSMTTDRTGIAHHKSGAAHPGAGTTLGSAGLASLLVRSFGISDPVTGAGLVLSAPTLAGAFAARAAVIDHAANDSRTLLPKSEQRR